MVALITNGQQGGKRRFGGAGEGVVGAGVGDAAGGDITGIGRDGCSHVGHNRAFPILAFTGKTTLCVCESELTAIACDGLARCGVIYVALRCPHIADGTPRCFTPLRLDLHEFGPVAQLDRACDF